MSTTTIPGLIEYSVASSLTLLAYDLLCTLDREIVKFWKTPVTYTTVIFFLNRYLPFVDTTISLLVLSGRYPVETCERGFAAVLWLIFLGIIISELGMMFRTYAIWGMRRSMLIVLAVLMAVIFIPSAAIAYLEVSTLKYHPVGPNETGCQLDHASPIIFIAYVLLMSLETVIVGLTLYQAVRHLRCTKSPWIVSFYRDGLLYYFYVLGISIANVLIPVLAPPAFSNWLATPQRVIHSVICTRVLLYMRELPDKTGPQVNSIPLSQLSFAQRSEGPEEALGFV